MARQATESEILAVSESDFTEVTPAELFEAMSKVAAARRQAQEENPLLWV